MSPYSLTPPPVGLSTACTLGVTENLTSVVLGSAQYLLNIYCMVVQITVAACKEVAGNAEGEIVGILCMNYSEVFKAHRLYLI